MSNSGGWSDEENREHDSARDKNHLLRVRGDLFARPEASMHFHEENISDKDERMLPQSSSNYRNQSGNDDYRDAETSAFDSDHDARGHYSLMGHLKASSQIQRGLQGDLRFGLQKVHSGDGAGHNRSAEEAAKDNTETENTVIVAATAQEEKQEVAAGSLGVAAGALGVAAGSLGDAAGSLGDADEDMKDPQIASSSGDDKDDTGTKVTKIVKREMVIECIAPYEKYKWKNIGAMKDGARSDNIQYATAFSPPYHLQSILRMQGHSKKGSSKTTNNTMIFIVLQGAVTVTLNGQLFTAKKGDSFFFPAQSTYDLSNEWDETVEMSLLQFHYHQEMRCVPVDPDSTLA